MENEDKIRIITAGCARFRDPISLNLEQAKRFGYSTTTYDLGNLNIEGSISHEIDSAEFKAKGRYYRVPGVGYACKSIHKGDIIADCLATNPDDLSVYMDGDAMMIKDLDAIPDLLGDCDIGVTIRDPVDMIRSLGKNDKMRRFLGCINAGIIVFAPTEKAREFVKNWSAMIEASQSDQKALNELINPKLRELKVGFVIETKYGRVKCLDGKEYNYGYWPQEPTEEVRIVHAKGLRFRGSMDRLAALTRNEPVLPFRGYESDFEGFFRDIQWEDHSISNVEAYYWWALIAKYKPDVVLESGICKGRSTHIIAEACKFYNIPYHIALEKSHDHEKYIHEKFADYDIEFHYGRSSDAVVKSIAPKISKYRTLLIVDGPKEYKQSMRLYQSCKHLNIVGIGVHDCSSAGGCQKALADARSKYWPRAAMSVTHRKTNAGLYQFNEPIQSDLDAAYEVSKASWSQKVGKEITVKDYSVYLSMVGICEIEGK
jgi:hypothetical protein